MMYHENNIIKSMKYQQFLLQVNPSFLNNLIFLTILKFLWDTEPHPTPAPDKTLDGTLRADAPMTLPWTYGIETGIEVIGWHS